MKHTMHLDKSSFERMKAGKKKIEGRLHDEKRQKIKAGDEIIFISGDDKIETTVTNMVGYKTPEEMYEKTERELWANKDNSKENFINWYYEKYSHELIEKYGLIAIYLGEMENEKDTL